MTRQNACRLCTSRSRAAIMTRTPDHIYGRLRVGNGMSSTTRRHFLATVAATSATLATPKYLRAAPPIATFDKAQIAITLDLEMARNFPNWEDTHWDYEKGNLNEAAKD